MIQIGSRYIGSSTVVSSIGGEEIIPEKDACYKFSFINQEDCTVKINGSEPIFIPSGIGFSMNEVDRVINNFIIVEDGIPYTWIGGCR